MISSANELSAPALASKSDSPCLSRNKYMSSEGTESIVSNRFLYKIVELFLFFSSGFSHLSSFGGLKWVENQEKVFVLYSELLFSERGGVREI
jgi:hypothetical protein